MNLLVFSFNFVGTNATIQLLIQLNNLSMSCEMWNVLINFSNWSFFCSFQWHRFIRCEKQEKNEIYQFYVPFSINIANGICAI
jgi:hypothetical protein